MTHPTPAEAPAVPSGDPDDERREAVGGRVRLITVCDRCLRASCWHGEFFCEAHQYAGTVQRTSAELRKLNREHPHHFSRANVERICGGSDWREATA